MITLELIQEFALQSLLELIRAIWALVVPSAIFVSLAFALKRREAWEMAKAALPESSINLWLYILPSTLFLPLNALVSTAIWSASNIVRPCSSITRLFCGPPMRCTTAIRTCRG